MINYAKPNQKFGFVRYNRVFAITVIVITEFDCICELKLGFFKVPIPYFIVIRGLFICKFFICEPNFLVPIFHI